MSDTVARRLGALVATPALIVSALGVATPAHAVNDTFTEETAEAFWGVQHDCADGSVVTATLLVRTTRDFESPETEDPDPTARVQYLAVCPDGSSFSWAGIVPAVIESAEDLASVEASGAGTVRDNLGVTHPVSFDVTWTAVGPMRTTVNSVGSKRKQRTATATGQVTFDGGVLVDGPADHPTRPAPFIRVDIEK
jgi:hypothetical protein